MGPIAVDRDADLEPVPGKVDRHAGIRGALHTECVVRRDHHAGDVLAAVLAEQAQAVLHLLEGRRQTLGRIGRVAADSPNGHQIASTGVGGCHPAGNHCSVRLIMSGRAA